MLFIDFDGVILDTEPLLFEEWRKNPNSNNLSTMEKIRYIQTSNWKKIINYSEIINDSIYYLKQLDSSTSSILTKVHSLENEANEKIIWLRSKGIKQNIILVPYVFKKADIVDAKNNILVDDCLKNLEEWENCGGIPIFFDMDNDNIDSWNQENKQGYQKVLTLESFCKKGKWFMWWSYSNTDILIYNIKYI